jgi:CubicO group peptidase (beta-lactamase class C family)
MRPLLSLFLCGASAASAAAQESPTLVGPLAKSVDSVIAAAEGRGFSGVVLIAKDGTPILRKGYGLAQREERTPFAPNTVVQIGSNTKDFTAVAILQLMERDRLRLEDSLAKFFPGAPQDKRAITVWQLLRQRSGLPIGIAPDPERLTRQEFLDRVMRTPLQFRPGEGEQYSNAGYSVLAAIIEQLSGKTYDEYLRDNLLAPVGLHDTGYLLPNFARRRIAHGYSSAGDKGTILDLPHLPDGPSWTLRGNGGMLSTVSDMAAFYAALYNTDRLLTAGARDKIFRPDEPVVLAGSDMVSFFMYQREPAQRLEVFLASTSTDVRAPQILREIAPLFGLGRGARETTIASDAPEIRLPATNVGRALRDYLDMFNTADSAAAVRFFTERMAPRPDAPPPAARYGRLREARGDLGKLVPVAYREENPQSAEVRARSSMGEIATILVEVEDAAPYRIKSLRVRVGG